MAPTWSMDLPQWLLQLLRTPCCAWLVVVIAVAVGIFDSWTAAAGADVSSVIVANPVVPVRARRNWTMLKKIPSARQHWLQLRQQWWRRQRSPRFRRLTFQLMRFRAFLHLPGPTLQNCPPQLCIHRVHTTHRHVRWYYYYYYYYYYYW